MEKVIAASAPGEIEELLARLIAIESHSEVPGQEMRLAVYIQQWFQDQGIECQLQEAIPGRPNVIARLAGRGGGKSLLLNGHLDTVPPYGMNDPFKAIQIGDRLYGRGSVDMKGALAAMMMTLASIHRSGISLAGDIIFAGTVGEESYSPGAHHLARSEFRADYGVVGEPTGMRVGIAHKGVAWFEADFVGRSVHGSVPEQGVNAIYRASRWINYIQDHYLPELKLRNHPLLGSPSLNIGMIQGGTRPVIVPNHCAIGFERRLLPGETAETALAELELTLAAVREEYPDFDGRIRISDNFHGVPHGPMGTSADSLLVKAMLEAYQTEFAAADTPKNAEPVGLQFWTDGALLQEVCPEIIVCGPGSIEQAHSNEEYIELGQLHSAYRMYVQSALTLAGQSVSDTEEERL
ncbi:M20 family metallopeptidase [Paenibacillus sp. 1011MAR3C5]|uniref:M20 family metallopeptidase n=1 Tax=Paenibacillus sp. 1011MAR3C5 TaxID=1675787 RepID=UPI001603DD6D|nr:ArgE/DapE family deacylase [Paenibacillus sp. 1011MAR3C5]